MDLVKKIEREADMYEYMVLKPLSMVESLLQGEHYQAAQKSMELVVKNAAEFAIRLDALTVVEEKSSTEESGSGPAGKPE